MLSLIALYPVIINIPTPKHISPTEEASIPTPIQPSPVIPRDMLGLLFTKFRILFILKLNSLHDNRVLRQYLS